MASVIFWIAGVTALGSALSVVTQRNPFQAALSLVLNLASLATLYLVLQADFLAAAQVLVYAGAVMMMFLFVIAYLGDRAELDVRRGGLGALAAVAACAAIVVEVLVAVSRSALLDTAATVPDDFGSPAAVGKTLLTDYQLAFELVSLLLLVGAVAGVLIGADRLLHAAREGEARSGPTLSEKLADVREQMQLPAEDAEEVAT